MTERLYYTDPYLTTFSATVVEQLTWEDQPAVVLDRTAFYPTSGGQPADTGLLGGNRVVDVVAREHDGAIVHVLEQALTEGEVHGTVDWHRRFDHMQQHTGQHLLSAGFEQLLGTDTVGFHLGAQSSTVDLDATRLDAASTEPVEELVNRVIWEDRPVNTRFVDSDQLDALPLRRPPVIEGSVRIIEVAGPPTNAGHTFDVNPCGGTHVARTGEIGLLKIVRLDYRGEETRVEFLCGERALRDYQAKNAIISQLASQLTVGYWELDQAVDRLQAEAKEARRSLRQAQGRLLKAEAAELARAADLTGAYRLVWQVWEQRDPGELRALAQAVAQHPGTVALLAGIGQRTHLCFSRAERVDLDVSLLLRQASGALGGKGGGQPHMAQGSAPVVDRTRVEAVISGLVSNLSPGAKV
jgi:alanyl-tRNA synthetase